MSPLANWLDAKKRALSTSDDIDPKLIARVALLSRRSPGYAALLDGWRPTTREGLRGPFRHTQDLPPVYEDALDFTAFALDQFRERADRDGTAVVILSSHTIGTRGDLGFDRLTALPNRGAFRHRPVRLHNPPGRRGEGCDMGTRRPLERRRPPVGGGSSARVPEAEPGDMHDAKAPDRTSSFLADGLRVHRVRRAGGPLRLRRPYQREHGGLPQVAVQRG